MIRDSLLEGPKSVYDLWKDILRKLENTPYAKPSYGSLRIMVYCLKKLGLIRKVSTMPSSRNGFYRKHLYSLVKARVKAVEWYSPIEALYRPLKFKQRIHLKKF
jgi:DNA-binding PadR family transcriptional regulator